MSARVRRDPQPGITARWPDTCCVCHGDIQQGVSRVVYRRGRPLHVECHGGFSDE